MNMPTIKSIGLPPEKHADRVVAEMLRWTVAAQTKRWEKIQDILEKNKDGNPRAQARMVQRLKDAGGAFFSDVFLDPGKRGRYTIHVLDIAGWNPIKKKPIVETKMIPDKPWLSCNMTKIESKGRGVYDYKGATPLFVTHHAMSRLAQRFGARNPRDLLKGVHAIWDTYTAMRTENMAAIKRVLPADFRLKFLLGEKDFAWAVLNPYDDGDGGLVVATILPAEAV